MGGGSSPQPAPAPTVTDTAEDWANAMPQVYQTQLEYAPLQAEQQMDLAQRYSLPYAQIYKQAQEALYPETSAIQEQLADKAMVGAEQGLTDVERSDYMNYFNSNLGTNAGSGMGANYVANNMIQQDQQRRDYYSNLGLSLAGRQPLSQPTTPQTADYMSGFTPNSAMGYNAQNSAASTAASASMYGANKGAQGQMFAAGGAAIGGIGLAIAV